MICKYLFSADLLHLHNLLFLRSSFTFQVFQPFPNCITFFQTYPRARKNASPEARSEDCIERLWDTSCLFGWSWVDWSGTPRPDSSIFKMLRESFSNLVLFFGKIMGSRKPHYEKKHTCFFFESMVTLGPKESL